MTVKLIDLRTNEEGGHDPDDFFESGGKVVLEEETGTVDIEYSQRDGDNFLIYRWTADVWGGRPEWWSRTLDAVARTYGVDAEYLRESLKGSDPLSRAYAYIDIADYYGLMNFDSDPLRLTPFEMTCRYSRLLDIKIPLLDELRELLKKAHAARETPCSDGWSCAERNAYSLGSSGMKKHILADIYSITPFVL